MSLASLYVYKDTIIHRLAPQMKIIVTLLIMVAAIVSYNFLWSIFLFAVAMVTFLLARVPFNRITLFVRTGLWVGFILFLAWSVFGWNFGGSVLLSTYIFGWNLLITTSRISQGISTFFRLQVIVYSAMMLFTTSSQMDIVGGLKKLGLPYGLCMMISLALRLIPTFTWEYGIIHEAMKIRGIDFSSKNLLNRLRATISLFIPLITSAVSRIIVMGNALDTRAFKVQLRPDRTYFKDYKLHRIDYALAVPFLILFVIAVLGAPPLFNFLPVIYW